MIICPFCSGYGGAVVRRLLQESEALVFKLDKSGYASDLTSIEALPQAAESHVGGTFQLLQAVRAHWEGLSAERKAGFRFHHISTDEVFGCSCTPAWPSAALVIE